ncbi:MAG TPA: biopolymer transporter ExbD, partial [Phnomibacter sp.]|nr:biopolymer transporter ExbD [Phnomibacter sp.]
MGRPKIARKSTWVDMTAFCDVAFLLLAFFILTTRFKPPEALSVVTPSSVSSKEAENDDQCMVSIGPDGRVFISFSEENRRVEVIDDLNKRLGLTLTEAEVQRAATAEYFASPLNTLKSFLNLEPDARIGAAMPGIPVRDTANNEMKEWIRSVNNVFLGEKLNLMVKGDQQMSYPYFKGVIDAFKANDQMKFQI